MAIKKVAITGIAPVLGRKALHVVQDAHARTSSI